MPKTAKSKKIIGKKVNPSSENIKVAKQELLGAMGEVGFDGEHN